LNLDIGICLGFSALGLGFPCRVSLRTEGVAIPEKQNPDSETLNGAGRKTTGQETQQSTCKTGKGSCILSCNFAFLLLLFGLGILVLVFWYYMKKQSVISSQQSAVSS